MSRTLTQWIEIKRLRKSCRSASIERFWALLVNWLADWIRDQIVRKAKSRAAETPETR